MTTEMLKVELCRSHEREWCFVLLCMLAASQDDRSVHSLLHIRYNR